MGAHHALQALLAHAVLHMEGAHHQRAVQEALHASAQGALDPMNLLACYTVPDPRAPCHSYWA